MQAKEIPYHDKLLLKMTLVACLPSFHSADSFGDSFGHLSPKGALGSAGQSEERPGSIPPEEKNGVCTNPEARAESQ